MRKFNVNVNGNSYLVEVEEVSDGASVETTAPVAAPAAAPAPVAAKPVNAAPKAPAGGTIVKSPMPGTVLKLAVANGAVVKKGDRILVLEAMKMENDINASADGTVTFLVAQGASVETGADLASVK